MTTSESRDVDCITADTAPIRLSISRSNLPLLMNKTQRYLNLGMLILIPVWSSLKPPPYKANKIAVFHT